LLAQLLPAEFRNPKQMQWVHQHVNIKIHHKPSNKHSTFFGTSQWAQPLGRSPFIDLLLVLLLLLLLLLPLQLPEGGEASQWAFLEFINDAIPGGPPILSKSLRVSASSITVKVPTEAGYADAGGLAPMNVGTVSAKGLDVDAGIDVGRK
jgi:hypothetical protein